MKCCNHEHNENSNDKIKGHNHKNHMWMMLLCCLAPLAIIFLLSGFGNSIPAARNIMWAIAPFLCPVMMLVMLVPMVLSRRKDKQPEHSHCETQQVQD